MKPRNHCGVAERLCVAPLVPEGIVYDLSVYL